MPVVPGLPRREPRIPTFRIDLGLRFGEQRIFYVVKY
jgi:hypothetical protein